MPNPQYIKYKPIFSEDYAVIANTESHVLDSLQARNLIGKASGVGGVLFYLANNAHSNISGQ